jgi:CRP-like cAMP-binding protein
MENSMLFLHGYLNKFYPVSQEVFQQFSPYFFTRQLKTKERLTDEGQMEENIYFIVKGLFRKYFRKGKHEFISQFYKESEICPIALSYYTGQPSPFIIEAIEPAICIGIHRRDLEMFLLQMPDLQKVFYNEFTQLYIKRDLREVNRALKTKKELFLDFCNNHSDLLQRIPQKYIASYLQIAPETFCRMKHVLYNNAKSDRQIELSEAIFA